MKLSQHRWNSCIFFFAISLLSGSTISSAEGTEGKWRSPDELKQKLRTTTTRAEQVKLADNLCGPIAVYLAVAVLLDQKVEFVDVVDRCKVSNDEEMATMLSVKQACKYYGFNTRARRIPSRSLNARSLPAILYLDRPSSHFVLVAFQSEDGTFCAMDLLGSNTLTQDQLDRRWSGYLIELDYGLSTWQIVGLYTITVAASGLLLYGAWVYSRKAGRTRIKSNN